MPRRRYLTDPPTQPIESVRRIPAVTLLDGWRPLEPPVIYDALAAECGWPIQDGDTGDRSR